MNNPIIIPFEARKALRRFEPAIRARINALIMERMSKGGVLTWDALNDLISDVFNELTNEAGVAQPDPIAVQKAWEEYKSGDFKKTKDWINELRGSMAAVCPG